MKRKFHVGFGEEGACFLPEAIQERRCALTLPESPTVLADRYTFGCRVLIVSDPLQVPIC